MVKRSSFATDWVENVSVMCHHMFDAGYEWKKVWDKLDKFFSRGQNLEQWQGDGVQKGAKYWSKKLYYTLQDREPKKRGADDDTETADNKEAGQVQENAKRQRN